MIFKWKEYPRELKLILSVYSPGFLGGTFNHIKALWIKGLFGADAPLIFNIYRDSLTLFDPLAALLIWIRPKQGIALSVLIMFSNVIINAYCYFTGVFGKPVAGMVPRSLFLQSLFATYVFITAPLVLKKLRRSVVISDHL